MKFGEACAWGIYSEQSRNSNRAQEEPGSGRAEGYRREPSASSHLILRVRNEGSMGLRPVRPTTNQARISCRDVGAPFRFIRKFKFDEALGQALKVAWASVRACPCRVHCQRSLRRHVVELGLAGGFGIGCEVHRRRWSQGMDEDQSLAADHRRIRARESSITPNSQFAGCVLSLVRCRRHICRQACFDACSSCPSVGKLSKFSP